MGMILFVVRLRCGYSKDAILSRPPMVNPVRHTTGLYGKDIIALCGQDTCGDFGAESASTDRCDRRLARNLVEALRKITNMDMLGARNVTALPFSDVSHIQYTTMLILSPATVKLIHTDCRETLCWKPRRFPGVHPAFKIPM